MDYVQRIEQSEKDQLTYLTDRTNQTELKREDQALLLNLSISQILQNLSSTFVEILNDILGGNWTGARGFIMIFFKGDRMIYVGLLALFCAFCIYLIDITS